LNWTINMCLLLANGPWTWLWPWLWLWLWFEKLFG
jgi:hypothetical protein